MTKKLFDNEFKATRLVPEQSCFDMNLISYHQRTNKNCFSECKICFYLVIFTKERTLLSPHSSYTYSLYYVGTYIGTSLVT